MISLTRKIINQIEQKQEIFRGLKGLRITELKKIVKPLNETAARSNSLLQPGISRLYETQAKDSSNQIMTGPQKLTLKNDDQIDKFWTNNCKTVPLSTNKIGELFGENEHIVCKLESFDMWISVELGMKQGKYNIDANMDLKIMKSMLLKDFKNLMQKLAL